MSMHCRCLPGEDDLERDVVSQVLTSEDRTRNPARSSPSMCLGREGETESFTRPRAILAHGRPRASSVLCCVGGKEAFKAGGERMDACAGASTLRGDSRQHDDSCSPETEYRDKRGMPVSCTKSRMFFWMGMGWAHHGMRAGIIELLIRLGPLEPKRAQQRFRHLCTVQYESSPQADALHRDPLVNVNTPLRARKGTWKTSSMSKLSAPCWHPAREEQDVQRFRDPLLSDGAIVGPRPVFGEMISRLVLHRCRDRRRQRLDEAEVCKIGRYGPDSVRSLESRNPG
nr:hypothetical protein CFP56_07671 [Quercus suber]